MGKDKATKNYYKLPVSTTKYDHNLMTDHYINYVGLYYSKK